MGIRLKPSGNLTTKGGIAIKKSGRTQRFAVCLREVIRRMTGISYCAKPKRRARRLPLDSPTKNETELH
jgi:hypothetical protein